MEIRVLVIFGTYLLYCSGSIAHAFIFDTFFGECSKNHDCLKKKPCDIYSESVCVNHYCKCHRIPTTTKAVIHSRDCHRDEDCSSWYCDSSVQSIRCLNETTIIFLTTDKLTCCCADKNRKEPMCNPFTGPKYIDLSASTSVSHRPHSTQKNIVPSFLVCQSNNDCSSLMCDLGLIVRCLPYLIPQPATVCLCADPHNGLYNTSAWPIPRWSHLTTLQTTKRDTKPTMPSTVTMSTTQQMTLTRGYTTMSSTVTTSTTQQTTLYRAPCKDAFECTAQNTQAMGPFGILPCTAADMRICSNGFCSCNTSFIPSTTTTMTPSTAMTSTQKSTSQPVTLTPPTFCYQCGGHDYPCSARDLFDNSLKPRACPGDKQFCMTDVGHHDSKLFVYKRCVDESTCIRQWLQETSDLDYCVRFNQIAISGSYECHFCCHGDGCNSGITPPNNKSLYLGQQS